MKTQPDLDPGLAQGQLDTLILSLRSIYNTAVNNSTAISFPTETASIGAGVYFSNTSISLSDKTITFTEPGQYVIYVDNATAGAITFTNCNFDFSGIASLTNTQIFWYSPNGITVTGSSVPGNFVSNNSSGGASASITATNTTFSGNIYNKGPTSLTSVIFNPVTFCYLKGTRILTENGYKYIKELKVGDNVVTKGSIVNNEEVVFSESELKPIKWIGSFYARRRDASDLPICFKAGSLGDNIPSNDLYVSPGHRVIIDGKMVIARDAVNGDSIVQSDDVDTIQYFHFELDSHSAIDAEGALAETLFDTEDGYYKSKF